MTKARGHQRVSLLVDDENFAFAEAMAEVFGFYGPADYLNAILNTALLEAVESAGPQLRPEGEKLTREEPGGERQFAGDGGDIDDSIPF